ncbi:MAG TPA: transcriptional Coactivator p15 (PC4) [Thermotogaceae bacterium]|nr:transcriptional Coactivator p15 (PC4) [Thermotogaceae bacterium]
MITLPKNSREVIRISVDKYAGKDIINIRVFYDPGTGEYRPTRKGLAIRVEMLDDLIDALNKIREEIEINDGEDEE